MSEQVIVPPDDLADPAAVLLQAGFHAEADDSSGTTVVRLHGDLDMASAPGLTRALSSALDAGPPALVVDLSELDFVDSTGIRVLITACRRAGNEGCSFVVRGPRRPVLKALRLTGVDRLMVIEPAPSPD